MTFETQSKLPASDKFYMVRIEGGRLFLNASYTATGATDTWQGYIGKWLDVYAVAQSNPNPVLADQSFTQKDTVALMTSDRTYHYQADTGILTVRSSLIPLAADEHIIISYRMHFTEFVGRYAPSNLTTPSGNDVYWQARLDLNPNLDFSQVNGLEGLLSISTSRVRLKNNDLYFNDFFGSEDSFNNRTVVVWRCIGNASNNQVEFVASIKGGTVDDNFASFELNDFLSKLDETCYAPAFGTSDPDEVARYYSDLYDNNNYKIRSEDRGRPLRRFFGNTSPYDLDFINIATSDFQQAKLAERKSPIGTCIDYNGASKTTSTNRSWSFGLLNGTGMTGTVSAFASDAVTFAGITVSKLTLDGSADSLRFLKRIRPGDSIINSADYGIVFAVDGSNVYVYPHNAGFNTGDIETKTAAAVLIIQDGVKYYPLAGRDYNDNTGNYGDEGITFTNNFEANHSGLGTLDPDACEVYARMNCIFDGAIGEQSFNGSRDIVAHLVEKCGLAIDMETPTPDFPLAFSIPLAGVDEFPSYREIIEGCLRSNMAYIYFINSPTPTVGYGSFLDDSAANQSGFDEDEQMDESNTSSASLDFDLYDQCIGLQFNCTQTPYNRVDPTVDFSTMLFQSASKGAARLFLTNKIRTTETFFDIHYYDDFESDLEDYAKLVINRKMTATITSFSRHFTMVVGDKIKLARQKITGGVDEMYLRLAGLTKQTNQSNMKLVDTTRFPG